MTQQYPPSGLGVHALSVRIHRQPLLRHLHVAQEVEGHPDQVALDAVELLLDFVDWEVGHEMPLLVVLVLLGVRGEAGVVFECAD
jgi:hypothetical protein